MEEARFTLRIHPIIMNKMKHLAKINGRSVNKEIEQILKWVIMIMSANTEKLS